MIVNHEINKVMVCGDIVIDESGAQDGKLCNEVEIVREFT